MDEMRSAGMRDAMASEPTTTETRRRVGRISRAFVVSVQRYQ